MFLAWHSDNEKASLDHGNPERLSHYRLLLRIYLDQSSWGYVSLVVCKQLS
jgi:hypothetical protein